MKKNLYKIGFSAGTVAQRIANAKHDPTFLMAPVEIIADYTVCNIRPAALERLIHRVFADARLDLTQTNYDRSQHNPSEWFTVPLSVIDQAIKMINSGDITDYIYDKNSQQLIWTGNETAAL
ncbi:GIY-YIG nuclease family protein [Canibacter zhuwentaonis]|uniref:GIY-YIG nuclease family protein n=1 Tax=Canibacter zhuwentaonis TaxID=2837491 RepID=UPI003510CD67